jgi:hypothetical protein
LDITELSEAASVAHVFPAMANYSLLSVGQLYNEGYNFTFKIDGITIFNDVGKAIMKGYRDLGTGFWFISMCKDKPQTPISAAYTRYELCYTGELVNY